MTHVTLDIQPVRGYAYPITSAISDLPAGGRCLACDNSLNGVVTLGPFSGRELCLCRTCTDAVVGKVIHSDAKDSDGVTAVVDNDGDGEISEGIDE